MRATLNTSAWILIGLTHATTVLAQGPVFSEGLQIYPNRDMDGTTFISRLLQTNGQSDVTGYMEYSQSNFEGIGDVSTAGNPVTTETTAIVLRYQDQLDTTGHNFDLVYRTADSTGAPDTSAAGLVAEFLNIASPVNPTPFNGAVQWTVELTFQNATGPAPLPLPAGTFFVGMTLKSNPNWPASDGLSFYEAQYDPASFNQTAGDNPRPTAPNLTWEHVGTSVTNNFNIPPFNSIGVVLNYNLIMASPVLQVGAAQFVTFHSTNEGFGAAGLYPDLDDTPPDGAAFRFTHTTAHTAGDIFGLYIALNAASSLSIPPIPLGGINGNLYLGPLALSFVVGGAMDPNSQDTMVVVAQPGTIPVSAKGVDVFYQGFVTTGPNAELTNMAVTKY